MDLTTLEPKQAIEAITQAADKLATLDAEGRWYFFLNLLKKFFPKLLTAVFLLIFGLMLTRLLIKCIRKLLGRSHLDPALHGFLISILTIMLYILLGVIVLSVLVPDTIGMLVALFSVFGLAISLAVKDSLANLAGGISVLFTRPFALGDYVQIGGNEGNIEEIRLNYTILKTVDNKLIHIPNGDVAKAQIINYTSQTQRRLDLEFSIGYGDDFEKAKQIINEIIVKNPKAQKEPDPIVRMMAHGDSAIIIGCRVWCATEDYWGLKYDMLEEVKRQFDAQGISIPYNQLDVHLHNPA